MYKDFGRDDDELSNETDGRKHEARFVPAATSCQRSVLRGRKRGTCGDTTNVCQSGKRPGRCPNHCDDAECSQHGHYKNRR